MGGRVRVWEEGVVKSVGSKSHVQRCLDEMSCDGRLSRSFSPNVFEKQPDIPETFAMLTEVGINEALNCYKNQIVEAVYERW